MIKKKKKSHSLVKKMRMFEGLLGSGHRSVFMTETLKSPVM